jgi:hypothetical protein
VDPEMQRWSALLQEELSDWPDVTSRPMFGLLAYYRAGVIFAALPLSRAVETPSSILLKLGEVRSPSLGRGGPGGKWVTFELTSSDDVDAALRWLERAYVKARRPVSSTSRRKVVRGKAGRREPA